MIDVSNAFSINMLNADMSIEFKQLTTEAAKELAAGGIVSHIGHADMAAVVGDVLGMEVPMNRSTMTFSGKLLVAQYRGPRLPEGTTALPDGATIEWWLLTTKA